MKHYDYVKDDNVYCLFHPDEETIIFLTAHGIARVRGERHQYEITQLTKRLLDEYLKEEKTVPE